MCCHIVIVPNDHPNQIWQSLHLGARFFQIGLKWTYDLVDHDDGEFRCYYWHQCVF